MPSYTPQEHADATVWEAMKHGFASGGLVAIPSTLAVYAAMQFSPMFVKSTNWQSRTALVIMPPLFAFAAAAENKLVHRMHEMAAEKEHSNQMAEWSTESQQQMLADHKKQLKKMSTQKILAQPGMRDKGALTIQENEEKEREIALKFRESVVNSGVRVVPGDSLGVHHRLANFWQENPFKILCAIGVPTVFYIFKGREGQQHLQLQMKLMHTRVFGQFAVISMLLSLMGFKEYMDRSGKFVTEADVQSRVAEMQLSRAELLSRLHRDRIDAEKIAEKRRRALEEDMKSGVAKKTSNASQKASTVDTA
jgi:two-component sensor histidine kinase